MNENIIFCEIKFQMFTPKMNAVLRAKNATIQDWNKFQGWVDQYHQHIKYHIFPSFSQEKIIHQELPTLNSLLFFLNIIKEHYYSSNGNTDFFKQSLFSTQPKVPPNQPNSVILNQRHNQIYRLFNILIVSPVETPNLVTYSSFDKLLVQLILSWCIYHQKTIDLKFLFEIIDQINGDFISPN